LTRRAEAALTEAKAVEACQGLMRFLQHPLRGSWWENLAEGGAPRREPARTSSLYHIVGAYHELAALEARRSLPVAKEETRASSTA
ncbi:AGE family epimerase/isomerase, partial [Rhodovulum sulfidophilum]|nr:AGE family epimerase/isomerase [Rhodovulum sulfidophilum]